MKSHLMKTPGGKSRLKNNVKRLKKGDQKDFNRYAYLKLNEDQSCSFLAKDGLCSLQRDCGEKSLPSTCATFPRRIFLNKTNPTIIKTIKTGMVPMIPISDNN